MKKVFLGIFLALSLAICVRSAPGCNLASNPQLNHFKELGVKTFEKPSSTSSKCVDEWAEHGTCCEETSLISLLQSRERRDAEDLRVLVEEVREIAKIFSAVAESGELIFKSTTNSSSAEAFRRLKGHCKQLAEYAARELPRLEESTKACQAKMHQVRSGSVCGVCSGRGDQFLTSGRLSLSLEACQSIVEACAVSWDKLGSFVGQVSLLVQEASVLRRLEKRFHFHSSFPQIEQAAASLKALGVAELLRVLNSDSEKEEVVSSTYVKACNSVVSLFHRSLTRVSAVAYLNYDRTLGARLTLVANKSRLLQHRKLLMRPSGFHPYRSRSPFMSGIQSSNFGPKKYRRAGGKFQKPSSPRMNIQPDVAVIAHVTPGDLKGGLAHSLDNFSFP